MNRDAQVKSKNPMWTWIGCGCGAIVALGLALVLTLTWLGYKAGKSFEADMKDPEARDRRCRDILGYQELPAGYHAAGGFELPFVIQMAMLTDRDIPAGERVDEDSAFDKSGFVFLKLRGMSDRDKKRFEDYLEGRSDDSDFFGVDHSAVKFARGKVLGRGRLALADATARYVAQQGRRAGGDPSLITVIAIECAQPPDSRSRIAVWFETESTPADPANPYAGTPADESRLAEFLGHFKLCQ